MRRRQQQCLSQYVSNIREHALQRGDRPTGHLTRTTITAPSRCVFPDPSPIGEQITDRQRRTSLNCWLTPEYDGAWGFTSELTMPLEWSRRVTFRADRAQYLDLSAARGKMVLDCGSNRRSDHLARMRWMDRVAGAVAERLAASREVDVDCPGCGDGGDEGSSTYAVPLEHHSKTATSVCTVRYQSAAVPARFTVMLLLRRWRIAPRFLLHDPRHPTTGSGYSPHRLSAFTGVNSMFAPSPIPQQNETGVNVSLIAPGDSAAGTQRRCRSG